MSNIFINLTNDEFTALDNHLYFTLENHIGMDHDPIGNIQWCCFEDNSAIGFEYGYQCTKHIILTSANKNDEDIYFTHHSTR